METSPQRAAQPPNCGDGADNARYQHRCRQDREDIDVHTARLRRAAGRLLALVPAVRRSQRQVTPYARYWAERSQLAGEQRQRGEPAWVVLGDSTAQGIGASCPERGWVGRVAAELPGWLVVNVSRSGARTASVTAEQLPAALAVAAPALLTVVIGGNDLLHSDPARWLAELVRLLAQLPPGSVVATPPRGLRERHARAAAAVIRGEAARRELRVADLWAATGPPYRGLFADGLHPNDLGYRRWADVLGPAVVPAAAALLARS